MNSNLLLFLIKAAGVVYSNAYSNIQLRSTTRLGPKTSGLNGLYLLGGLYSGTLLYVSLKECSYYVLSHFIDLSNMHTL